MNWWRYYTPKPRKEVKGGIKAQTKRGAFGASWWAKRWIAVLESFDIGARLGRGRSYARSGQVMDIEIDQGAVRARVQGSRSRPYEVEILIRPLARAKWDQVVKVLSSQFIYVAKLLAGEMPQEIEEVFAAAHLSLFPQKYEDLETDCSCPDWSNPCKHVAAVFYLLGEEFDRDPFLLFKLRGLAREELMELLGGGGAASLLTTGADRDEAAPAAPEALTPEPTGFWEGTELPADLFGEVRLPEIAAALPKRLGNFPFWRGKTALLEALQPLYQKAAPAGLDAFLGLAKPAAAAVPEAVTPLKLPIKTIKKPKTKTPPKKRKTVAKRPRKS